MVPCHTYIIFLFFFFGGSGKPLFSLVNFRFFGANFSGTNLFDLCYEISKKSVAVVVFFCRTKNNMLCCCRNSSSKNFTSTVIVLWPNYYHCWKNALLTGFCWSTYVRMPSGVIALCMFVSCLTHTIIITEHSSYQVYSFADSTPKCRVPCNIIREISLLRKLDHPNIVKLGHQRR